ncbi:MAG: PIN domain-containing protein [Candidatus Eisenbacteria bacterium]|nr:PIN domain-containing protein [Candidatus Eisenbacteria bacterium]
MRAVDTSVLAYAVNRFAPEHARAAATLEELANGDRPWALPWPAVHEFLARVTHPHAVARALRPTEAWTFVEELLRSPGARLLSATERHAAVAAEVLALMPGESRALPAGFELAVVLREHGVRELLSCDAGMRRWRFLDVRDPVHGALWTPDEKPARRYRTLGGRRR